MLKQIQSLSFALETGELNEDPKFSKSRSNIQFKTANVGGWEHVESDEDCGGRVRTKPSEAGRQCGRRAWGDTGHVAEHGRGAGAQVDQVVLSGLIQHLQMTTDANCGFMAVEQWRS